MTIQFSSPSAWANFRFARENGESTGSANSGAVTNHEADISPRNIPERYERIFLVARGGQVTLRVADSSGSVPDVWDHDPETMQHKSKMHNYSPGDVIMTYGQANSNGKPIVGRDGKQLLDQAVGDPKIIALTYVDLEGAYFNSGTKNNPVLSIKPGDTVEGKKEALVTLLIVPTGTTVLSLEQQKNNIAPHVIEDGQAVCVGPFEDPYHVNLAKVVAKHEADPAHPESAARFAELKTKHLQ